MAEQRLIPKFGDKVNLKEFDPDYTGNKEKEVARKETQKLEAKLAELKNQSAKDQQYLDGQEGRRVALVIAEQGVGQQVEQVDRDDGPLGRVQRSLERAAGHQEKQREEGQRIDYPA